MEDGVSRADEEAKQAAEIIAAASGATFHKVALILGSGWGSAITRLGHQVSEVEASALPGFSPSGVPGHTGSISSIRLPSGESLLAIGARSHLYEGKGVKAVVHPVRVAAECGATILILTNGAGGITAGWSPGQIVMISDHINLTGESPLEGASFLDMTNLYCRRLREIARKSDPSLPEGVYVQFRGPSYETPAEVQMAKAMGGHIVGMSTALEAIAAREAGMEVLGLSLITNLAAGISPHPLSHQEVIDSGIAAEPTVSKLLADIVHAL